MFRSIVFSQFYELKKQGKNPLKARPLVIIMIFVLIALLLFFIFLLVKGITAIPDFGMENGKARSKQVGWIVGGCILAIVYILTSLGFGEKLFTRYLHDFEQLDEATQLSEYKKGIRIFAVSLFTLLALVIGLAIYRI